MRRLYQVFISSTFTDLIDARQEVSKALLRADCFPAGMELFPATNDEPFAYIEREIRKSDFYVIISAGRYGSKPKGNRLSYTELEYDYAKSIGLPILAFVHADPFNALPGEFIENTQSGIKALKAFQEKIKAGGMVHFWNDSIELGREIAFALIELRRSTDNEGWVRYTEAFSSLSDEIGYLKATIANLENYNELLRKEIDSSEH